MQYKKILRLSFLLSCVLLLNACEKIQIKPTQVATPVTPECSCPSVALPPPEPPKSTEPKPEVVKVPDYGLLKAADWQELDAISKDDVTKAWPAWQLGCSSLKAKPAWQVVCSEADR